MDIQKSSSIMAEDLAGRGDVAAQSARKLRMLQSLQENSRLAEMLRNPLTLVLFTWLVMAILLWWEVAGTEGN